MIYKFITYNGGKIWIRIKRIYGLRTTLFISHKHRGFTLIEMLVAVSLFTVVMTISVGALLSFVDANKKAQALQSVMNNLNIAIGGMVRNVRMGSNYHCGSTGALQDTQDCVYGGNLIAFESFLGDPKNNADQWAYWVSNGRLYRTRDSRATQLPITAQEINIDTFKVYVTGAVGTLNGNGDINQPKVVLVIKGTVGVPGTPGLSGSQKKVRTTFDIEATASQRRLDL